MKGIGDGVWDRLIWNSTKNRMGWGGNCGIVDGINPTELDRFMIKIEWLHTQLKALNPKKILEIGTNYGSFSWLLYNTLDEFRLETCDVVEGSREEIRMINEYYGKDWVHFHHLSSKDFLPHRSGDLIWMDGNHNEEWVREEILWIEDIGVKEVWVDDWNWEEVRRGVMESESRYKVVETSPMGDVAKLRF